MRRHERVAGVGGGSVWVLDPVARVLHALDPATGPGIGEVRVGRAGGRSTVQLLARTVEEAVNALVAMYPDIRPRLLTENRKIQPFMNLYIDVDDIRFL